MGVRVVVMIPGDLPDKIKVNYPEITPKVVQPEAAKTSEIPVQPVSPPPETHSEPVVETKPKEEQPEKTKQEATAETEKKPAEKKKRKSVRKKGK
jgi:hypothetical protein